MVLKNMIDVIDFEEMFSLIKNIKQVSDGDKHKYITLIEQLKITQAWSNKESFVKEIVIVKAEDIYDLTIYDTEQKKHMQLDCIPINYFLAMGFEKDTYQMDNELIVGMCLYKILEVMS